MRAATAATPSSTVASYPSRTAGPRSSTPAGPAPCASRPIAARRARAGRRRPVAISPFEAQGQVPKTRSKKEVYEAYDVLWNLVWYYRKVIMESHGKLHPVSLPGMRKVEQRFP